MTLEPYYYDGQVTLYHADCRDHLTSVPNRGVLVTDPPYGIDLDTDYGNKNLGQHTDHERIHGDDEPFDPAHLLMFKKAVIFGANNFASRLPDEGSWIIWDKVTRNGMDVRIAEAELAWTRGVLRRTRVFRHLWAGAYRDSESGKKQVHPTQKPEALMDWVIDLVTEDNETVVDPYAGSGTTLVSAKKLGRLAIGYEINENYCEVIATRLEQGVMPW